ncbi:DNA breaking-rejoining protein [Buttiauxella gaviniae]|uniref:DNA breaking-rejoining protein n=1 Tax=Buttiauxella gaviniae TaxID=82990 RepID=UPI0039758704
MQGCSSDNSKLFGRAVVLEVALGCPDTIPPESERLPLMAGTSKGFDFSPNTVSSDADDTKGYVENIVTNSDFTISFEGEVRKNDKLDQFGVGKFVKYYNDEVKASRQPTIWVFMDYGPVSFRGYMVITALSSDGGSNDIVTLTTEFKVSAADTIDVEDNNVIVPMTFSRDLPATKTTATGGDAAFTVAVTGGNQPLSYTWYYNDVLIPSSDNPTAATPTLVNSSVNSLSAGSYKVEVTDESNQKITSTACVLTVTTTGTLTSYHLSSADGKSVITGADGSQSAALTVAAGKAVVALSPVPGTASMGTPSIKTAPAGATATATLVAGTLTITPVAAGSTSVVLTDGATHDTTLLIVVS